MTNILNQKWTKVFAFILSLTLMLVAIPLNAFATGDTSEGEGEGSTPPASPATYTVTVNYVDSADNTSVQSSYVSEALADGATYDVSAQLNPTIDGYTYSSSDLVASGTISGANVVITSSYTKDVAPIDNSPVFNAADIITLTPGAAIQYDSWQDSFGVCYYPEEYKTRAWVTWGMNISLSQEAIDAGITIKTIQFNPGSLGTLSVPANTTSYDFTSVPGLASAYKGSATTTVLKAMISFNIPAGVTVNGADNGYYKYAEYTGFTLPDLPVEKMTITRVLFDSETNVFTIKAEPGDQTNVRGVVGIKNADGGYDYIEENLVYTQSGDEWIATFDASAYLGENYTERFGFTAISDESTETVSKYISLVKPTFHDVDGSVIDNGGKYYDKDTLISSVAPELDDSKLLEGQKLAGSDLIGSWYVKHDNGTVQFVGNTNSTFELEGDYTGYYPIVLSEVKFNLNGEETSIWTTFNDLGTNTYDITSGIPSASYESLGYIWYAGNTEYTQDDIYSMNISEPITFTSTGEEVKPIDFARVIYSGEALTETYVKEAIAKELGVALADIEFVSEIPTDVVWNSRPTGINELFTESDVSVQNVTVKVAGSEQTVEVKIYPRPAMVNRVHASYAVQGSNSDIMIGLGLVGQIGYTEMSFGRDTKIITSSKELQSFYYDFYQENPEAEMASTPVLGINYYDTVLNGHYSTNEIEVEYYNGDIFNLPAEMNKENTMVLDTDVYNNYHFHMTMGALSIVAANNYEDSKPYDGFGYRFDTKANTAVEVDEFLSEVSNVNIDNVISELDDDQQLVIRFWNEATNAFDLAEYTTQSAPGVYEVPFKVLVADKDGVVLEDEFNAVQFGFDVPMTPSQIKEATNSYLATITIEQPPQAIYPVTVNRYDETSGTAQFIDSLQVMTGIVGTGYDIEASNGSLFSISGLTYTRTDGAAISGTIVDGGVVINLYFTSEGGTNPNPTPDPETTPDEEEILEDDVPLAPPPTSEEDEEEIIDEEIPLAVPATNDSRSVVPVFATAIASLLALAITKTSLRGRKSK